MTRVTITWLDILLVCGTVAATIAYYIVGIDTISGFGLVVSLVQYGKFLVIVYIALEILSAVFGEGGNHTLYWLSYIVTLLAAFAISMTAGYVYLGLQQNVPAVVHALSVPYAKELLMVLVVFSWFSALVLQGHKHTEAWTHVSAARAIAPAAPVAPIPPTVPAPAPTPGSAASVIVVLLLLAAVALAAYAAFGNGIRVTTIGRADGYSVADGSSDDCTPRYLGRDGLTARYEIPLGCK